MPPAGDDRRARLAQARLMLLFTPDLCPPGRDPLAILAAALPHVQVVQVRLKEPGLGLSPARASLAWTERVLALREREASTALVIVDDRPDVARALAERGVDGVHLGADDAPVELARALLGPEALIGRSTHSNAEVVAAEDLPVDYLGFGPVHATQTRGYARGLGAEAAWIAARASSHPLFPIGGIDATNAAELTEIGRAAVSRAVLTSADPAQAARELAALLTGEA